LIIMLALQLLIFLFIYFGSRKKLIFKPTLSNNPTQTKEKLPLRAFLICSLVMCGLRILSQGFYIIYPLISNNTDSDQTNYQTLLDHFMESEPTIAVSLVEILIGSVSLTGIFLIWKMKKLGFYVYMLAEAFFLFSFIFQMINLNVGLPGAIVIGWEMMWPVWDIVFIIICAKQLKHMTWDLNPLSTSI
jgi:hypothetical protein